MISPFSTRFCERDGTRLVVLLKEDMVVRRRLVGSMVVLLRDIRLRVGISNRDKAVILPRLLRLSIEA